MPRTWICAAIWIAGLLVGIDGLSAQTVPPSERLLPNTTKGYVAISSVDQLEKQWKRTQLGQLAADPEFEPFIKDLRERFQQRATSTLRRLGLTLKELRGIAGGEVAMGRILPAPGKAAVAAVVDVTGHLDEANKVLDTISENLIKQGAKREEITSPGSPDRVVFFDVPPPKDGHDGPRRKVYYFLVGNLLGAADDEQVIRGILSFLPESLDELLAFPDHLAYPFSAVVHPAFNAFFRIHDILKLVLVCSRYVFKLAKVLPHVVCLGSLL